MNVWSLPGPSAYVTAVERALRDGENVILRFPAAIPRGFESALHVLLRDEWHWDRVEAGATAEAEGNGAALHILCKRFAPELSALSGVTASDLCEAEAFRGRLIWITGLHKANWRVWRAFLVAYAQAIRSVRVLNRTLFVAPLYGVPRGEENREVALVVQDWHDVVDEMDLLFLASERLRGRGINGAMRLLLATLVARVAAWDCGVAERMAMASVEDIIAPCELLRAVAREREWTEETPVSWELGTESGTGVMHAALAAVREPREIGRRVWRAQVSVLLPVIESRRQDIVGAHRCQIEENLERTGERGDADDLEIGDLVRVFGRPGFDPEAGRWVRGLRSARNELAHCRPLPSAQALMLVRA